LCKETKPHTVTKTIKDILQPRNMMQKRKRNKSIPVTGLGDLFIEL
jgi:hypothetical protein